MTRRRGRVVRLAFALAAGLGVAAGCAFDDTLREYLDAHFWLPFTKTVATLERANVRRISVPFAGMIKPQADSPLDRLRAAYIDVSKPVKGFDPAILRPLVAAAKADTSLTAKQREEVGLIDAKIDMRAADPGDEALLQSARAKFEVFLRSARTPEFIDEARGWLAHLDYLTGNQTAAGKFYLDELNRNGSNLSRETILDSLRETYGYDGGPQLLAHLDEYFDTTEHAAFAIQLATNPRWNRISPAEQPDSQARPQSAQPYARVRTLLEQHAELFRTPQGASRLALLGMRTALRMGDPPGALKIADMVPAAGPARAEPDFEWMLGAARFLVHDFAGAEAPLLALFQSRRADGAQKAAAAYALCGVYEMTGNTVEQIRFALLLRNMPHEGDGAIPGIEDQSVYFASSGWDLGLLLDYQASDDALEAFLAKYPTMRDARLVKYALAVRRAREDRYDDAAQIFESIGASVRASRMRKMAALYRDASQSLEAKFKLAQYIAANQERLYFNNALWSGFQRYALFADHDDRLTRAEHERLVPGERKLQDDQEERWRAYLILKGIVDDAGKTDLGIKSAKLAMDCLRRISIRFGREEEIRNDYTALSQWLRE